MDAIARRAEEPGSREDTKGRGHRSDVTALNGKSVSDGQEGAHPPSEITREIPFHALEAHRKSRAFRIEFDIMRKSLAICGRISTEVFVVRASLRPAAYECIFHALRCILRRCVTIFFHGFFILKRLAYCLMWSQCDCDIKYVAKTSYYQDRVVAYYDKPARRET